MKVLGLIPARGGSKGVPGKNIKILNGRPLLSYAAASALRAKSLSDVVLSTDDKAIADIGIECGITVPFVRPKDLAQDSTPTLPVVRHALQELEAQGKFYDAVCLLQPTNPFRRPEDIDACVELLKWSGADSVITVLPVPHEYNPHWVYWKDETGGLKLALDSSEPVTRRQDLPTAYHRDGSVYVTRTEVIIRKNSLYGSYVRGFEIDPLHSANIDSAADWNSVEARMRQREAQSMKST